MKCPNCNRDINENSKYCNKCGYKIENRHNEQYLYSELYSKTFQKKVTSEEDYIKNYIGSNYETIKKEKFSLTGFIFGPLYLLYKKVYSPAILILLITVLIYSVNDYAATIFYIIISFYIGYKGNSIYLQHATRKVEELKISNPDKSSTEILDICIKEGKPNTYLLIILISIVITNLFIYSFINNYDTTSNEPIEDIQITSYKTQDINYELKSTFNNEAQTYKYMKSTYKDDNNNCSITIMSDKYIYIYQSLEDYINKNLYINSNEEIKENGLKTINNITYKKMILESNTHNRELYFKIYNNNVYYIEYSENKTYNNNYCKQEYNNFINSITFNKEKEQ